MITALRKSGSKPPLFLVHGSDGKADIFLPLSRYFDEDQPVFAISQPPVQSESVNTCLEDMAAQYLREVEALSLEDPFSFLGYSFGGLVAYEMANQLVQKGRSVAFLGMLDTWVPSSIAQAGAAESTQEAFRRKVDNLIQHGRNLLFGPNRIRWFRETVVSKALIKTYRLTLARHRTIPKFLRNANDLNIYAASQYHPSVFPGKIVLIRAKDEYRDNRYPADLGWGPFAIGGVEIHELAGEHRELAYSNPQLLAAIVSGRLSVPSPSPSR